VGFTNSQKDYTSCLVPEQGKRLSVSLPDGKYWEGWSAWEDEVTVWVDGRVRLCGPSQNSKPCFCSPLDIGSFGDKCCLNDSDRLAAVTLWSSGEVLVSNLTGGAPALILPYLTLNSERMREALARAWEAGLVPNTFPVAGCLA